MRRTDKRFLLEDIFDLVGASASMEKKRQRMITSFAINFDAIDQIATIKVESLEFLKAKKRVKRKI